ncbi:unnamed protein product [Rotaria socialis]|uniref:Uncharacterized protein n=2 Tax=Rotaria socialis TaxID=392032 RepID=A0A820K0E9_9BILA|nr:unnamed protein product [Rotaria socialis]CAF3576563.1 unnamed protein product [Rotaria socialis]CAF4230555.1 unnamed protein product [Rotaria socialis]CAF4335087.1 unnamed protein product [Rotaria socialis]CAF4795897.1 unnamed protein product [Rotaria socialis]
MRPPFFMGRPLSCVSRSVRIETLLGIIVSAMISIIAGILSYNSDSIDISFPLRQVTPSITVGITLLFFPIWLAIKTAKDMTKRGIILLIISGITCLITAIFIMIVSIPVFYVVANQNELWFYVFQTAPIVSAQIKEQSIIEANLTIHTAITL